MLEADYYVVATFGPFETRGKAQNALWDIEEAARTEMEEVPVRVTVKHGRD